MLSKTLALLSAALMLLLSATGAAADAPAPTVIVVDSSGSMAAQLDGEARLDTARKALAELLEKWPANAPVGVIAYGHRRASDCKDIEELMPIGPVDAPAIEKRLGDLRARGKTPLSASLQAAAELLKQEGKGGTIILLTDGIETCNADPCAVAAALHAADVQMRVHVVGFAIEEKDQAALTCIAENGGGLYRSADDAEELLAGLGQVAEQAVIEPPPPAPAPAPPINPVPELPKVEIPEQVPPVQVAFVALMGKKGPQVEVPASWRVTSGADVMYEGSGRSIAIPLLPGAYRVEASAANVAATLPFEAKKVEEMTVEVVLEAGTLAADVVPYKGAEPIKEHLTWTLTPLDGQGAVPEQAVGQPAWLLAAGKYRLAVETAGRMAEETITIKAGKAVESHLSFRLGELTLVAVLGGETEEPLTDWRGLDWRALAKDGTVVAEKKQSASPLFQLPAGTYTFELAIAGTTVSKKLEVVEGKSKEERFVVASGKRSFQAALGPAAEPFTDWRDARWTVTAIDAVGIAPGTKVMELLAAANPSADLLPGRWLVEVESDRTGASTEIAVAPDSDETVRLDVNGGRIEIAARPAEGQELPMNIVFEVMPLPEGEIIALGGSSEWMSGILPAGKWRVIATDSLNRKAERDIDLKAGDELTLELLLE